MATVELDQTPRYAPDCVLIIDGGSWRSVAVTGYKLYPPGTAPKAAPIKAEYWVLELQTAYGSRWYGVGGGYINSELRMVVTGIDPRDEVRAKWAIVPADRRI